MYKENFIYMVVLVQHHLMIWIYGMVMSGVKLKLLINHHMVELIM